jgi:hypothetical protein
MTLTHDYDRRWLKTAAARLPGSLFYHGTASDFDAFDLSASGARDFGDFGFGVYLTPSTTMARGYAYASAKRTHGEPKVLTVSVRLHNTADFDDPKLQSQIAETLAIPFPHKALTTGTRQTRPRSEAIAITDYVRALGYDSGLARNGKELVVYDPRAITIESVQPASEA